MNDRKGVVRPEAYYDGFTEGEWERLERNPKTRLEFQNTTAYLKRELPEEGRVLDAGGGAGRYSVWLAEQGYEVVLVDLSSGQLELAGEKVAEHGYSDQVSIQKGSVTDLGFADRSFDAVLCTGGPLSHLTDENDRQKVVRELARVAKPRSTVFVSVMGRLAFLQIVIKRVPEAYDLLPRLAETGDYTRDVVGDRETDFPPFASSHFFRVDELEKLLENGGLSIETIVGLEGPASNMGTELKNSNSRQGESLSEMMGRIREDRGVAEMSEHILVVTRA